MVEILSYFVVFLSFTSSQARELPAVDPIDESALQGWIDQGLTFGNRRQQIWLDCLHGNCYHIRGGADDAQILDGIRQELGNEFQDALKMNELEHARDCEAACELYYCDETDEGTEGQERDAWNASVRSYPFGAVPPEDFARDFGFPLDLIKVTMDPLFSAAEADNVVRMAEQEGLSENEFPSGKYKLGGNWLDNMPATRAWFNSRLRDTFFPLLHAQFPAIVSHPSKLRAHSVSLLKYNATHPRTDVHIDNGVLALTVAMSSVNNYTGGGTFFEHFDEILTMDIGHATVRPGSVRHGGQRVVTGTRYVLGCFLLVRDRVEHVRRFKNRGAAYRRRGRWEEAMQEFTWALAINPKCATCWKDWAETLQKQGKYEEAESKIRRALELLEYKDSDAYFNLGVILSLLGRDGEAVDAYRRSVKLNPDDTELLFNLGTKLGASGNTKEEMEHYEKVTDLDGFFGGAWLNWGTALAEAGNLDGAEAKFLRALNCDTETMVKALMNLSLIYHHRAQQLAQSGSLVGAHSAALQSSGYLERAKPLLPTFSSVTEENSRYIKQYQPQRLQSHRLLGQIYAALNDMDAAEEEFRVATKSFPDDKLSWYALQRVLELRGRTEEVAAVKREIKRLEEIDD